MIGKAIYTRLTTAGTATLALISTRLYPKVVPEHVEPVYPLAIYGVEDEERTCTYTGSTGLNSSRVVIACYATTETSAKALRRAVLDDLDNESGTWGGIVVQGAFFETENEIPSRDPTTGEESLLFGCELEFLVWYES